MFLKPSLLNVLHSLTVLPFLVAYIPCSVFFFSLKLSVRLSAMQQLEFTSISRSLLSRFSTKIWILVLLALSMDWKCSSSYSVCLKPQLPCDLHLSLKWHLLLDWYEFLLVCFLFLVGGSSFFSWGWGCGSNSFCWMMPSSFLIISCYLLVSKSRCLSSF